jgi:hypothetical protein
MFRSTIKSIAVVAAVAVLGTTGVADAKQKPRGFKVPPATTNTVAALKGTAPGKGKEMNDLCQQYADLADDALNNSYHQGIVNGDAAEAGAWYQLAKDIIKGGQAAGCTFTWS